MQNQKNGRLTKPAQLALSDRNPELDQCPELEVGLGFPSKTRACASGYRSSLEDVEGCCIEGILYLFVPSVYPKYPGVCSSATMPSHCLFEILSISKHRSTMKPIGGGTRNPKENQTYQLVWGWHSGGLLCPKTHLLWLLGVLLGELFGGKSAKGPFVVAVGGGCLWRCLDWDNWKVRTGFW